MKPISNIKELNAAIDLLKTQQTEQEIILKAQFKLAYESLQPISIVKNMLKGMVSDPAVKEGFLNTTISMAVGYISKKIAIGSSNNPMKQILGRVLQRSVTSMVAKNADGIRSKISDIISVMFQKGDSKE